MIPHLWLLPLSLLFCSPSALSLPDSSLTFNELDPVSGSVVTCTGCPPGRYLRSPCTTSHPSVCEECPPGSFTEIWNYIGRCLRCGVCGRNMVVKSACSPHSDCQCQCRPGFYYKERAGMCVRFSECEVGHGVSQTGTPHTDTVCSPCANGTFSDVVSSELNCSSHSLCEPQHKLLLKGSAWHDSVCTDCQGNTDAAEFLKHILPSFFSRHRLSLQRLRLVVRQLPSTDGRTKRRRSLSGLNQDELESRLLTWISESRPDQVPSLVLILKETGAVYTADRMESKLKRIESNLKLICSDQQ